MTTDFQNCNRVLITICKDDVIIKYNYFIDKFKKYHRTNTKIDNTELNIIVFKPNEIETFNNIVDNLNISLAELCTNLDITLQLCNMI